MRGYKVKVWAAGPHLNPFHWEGRAINCTDALMRARAAAEPQRWATYEGRAGNTNTAVPWTLLRMPDPDIMQAQIPIPCKVERIS